MKNVCYAFSLSRFHCPSINIMLDKMLLMYNILVSKYI